MKEDPGRDGGRHVRSARKQTQRDRASTGGALAQRRNSRSEGNPASPDENSWVRRQRRALTEAVRQDIVQELTGSPLPLIRL